MSKQFLSTITTNLLLLINKYQVKNTRFQVYRQQFLAKQQALQKTG